jgi:anti-sigma B factor antagonist
MNGNYVVARSTSDFRLPTLFPSLFHSSVRFRNFGGESFLGDQLSYHMRYTLEHEDNTATLVLHEERLDVTTSPDFKAELLIHTRSGIEVLFIDLHEVLFCDSTGLSAMLLAHREMKVAGGAAIFIGLAEHLQSLVKLAQLDTVLYIYDSREEAMADLQSENDDED